MARRPDGVVTHPSNAAPHPPAVMLGAGATELVAGPLVVALVDGAGDGLGGSVVASGVRPTEVWKLSPIDAPVSSWEPAEWSPQPVIASTSGINAASHRRHGDAVGQRLLNTTLECGRRP